MFMTRSRILATAALALGFVASPVAAQDATQMYECVAQDRVAGQSEPSLTSPPMRISNSEELRVVEEGGRAYASIGQGEPIPEWIALYDAPARDDSSFLGYYLSSDFTCSSVGN